MFKSVNCGKLPTKGSKYSACVDLYANEDVVIGAGDTKVIGIGVAIDFNNSNVYKNSDYMWTLKKYNNGSADKDVLEAVKKQAVNNFKKEHYLQLMLRSSLGKKGLILPNGVGVIDLDYEDEIKMIIHNPIIHIAKEVPFDKEDDYIEIDFMGVSDKDKYVCSDNYKIKKGDRIGQIALLEHKSYLFGIDTEEVRDGGFGSTGER